MTWEAPWMQRKKSQTRSQEDSTAFLSFLYSYSSDVRCSRVWDWPWVANCTAAEGFPTPLCYLVSRGRWARVTCWRSMTAFGTAAACSGLLCPAASSSSTQPQSLHFVSSDSQFCIHGQLQDPKRISSIKKKYSVSFFTLYLRSDFGGSIKKNSQCWQSVIVSRNVTSKASTGNGCFSCTFPLLFAHRR